MTKNSIVHTFAVLVLALVSTSQSARGQVLYWDGDGNTAGAGINAALDGLWSDSKWSGSSGGTVGTGSWSAGNKAVFSAGSTALNGAYTVDLDGNTESVSGVDFEEGVVTLANGVLQLTSSNPLNVISPNATNAILNVEISGTSGLTKDGGGILTLGGAAVNTYGGATTISAGKLKVIDASGDKIPDSSSVTISGGATLELATGVTEEIAALIGTASTATVKNDGTLIINLNSTVSPFSGTIMGSGSIIKRGSVEMSFSGTGLSTFSGGLTIESGGVGLGNSSVLPAFGNVTIQDGTYLNLYGNSNSIAGLSGEPEASVVFNGGILAVGAGNANSTYSGSFNGSFGSKLYKVGSGTLTLNGDTNSAFSGNVIVNAGTLRLDAPGKSPTGGAPIEVKPGGRLAGGQMNGDVNVNGGTIAPGASPGYMQTAYTTWEDDGAYEWEINNLFGSEGGSFGWDFLQVNGSLTINSTSVNPFKVKIISLDSQDDPGNLLGFDNTQDYVRRIANVLYGVSGWTGENVVADTTGFANAMGTGQWIIDIQPGPGAEMDIYAKFVHPPSVTTAVQDFYGAAGFGAQFIIAATGTGALDYQWFKDGTPLVDDFINVSGATTAFLNLFAVDGNDEGAYSCVVSNAFGTITNSGNLILVDPPVITTFAKGSTNLVGATVNFTNIVSGTQPFSYEWYKDGLPITTGTVTSNANSTVLTLSNVTTNDTGTYWVNVTNLSGAAFGATSASQPATLVVATAVQITTQPAVLTTANAGDSVSFTVVAKGGGLKYQWMKNGGNISGATMDTLYLSFVTDFDEDNDTLSYKCRISNIASPTGVVSSNARLAVNDPAITSHPLDQVKHPGQTAFFSVFAAGAEPKFYQWRKNGVNIAGATTAFYTIPTVGAGDYGAYSCLVTNNNIAFTGVKRTSPGFALSSAANLIQMQPPTIAVNPPATLIKPPDANAVIQVTADGTGPYYFQWRKNGVDLFDGITGHESFFSGTQTFNPGTGEQSAQMNISMIKSYDEGSYDVVITNDAGSITSTVVNIIISNEPPVVQILNPPNNEVFNQAPASFAVGVNAHDGPDGNVTNVSLYLNDFLVGNHTFGGNNSFNVDNLPADTYTLIAIAHDNLGLSTTSTPVVINVSNDCILPPEGIVGWWRGENNADDFYGNNNGTANSINYVTGRTEGGSAFRFDGSTSYVDLGNPTALQITGSLSVECWFKTDAAVGNYKTLVSKWFSGDSDASYALHWTDFGGLGFHIRNVEGQVLSAHSGATLQLNDGRWHHVAGTWDGFIISIYIDGQLMGSDSASIFGPISNTTNPVRIGTDNRGFTDRYFEGIIDEVAIYNRALNYFEQESIFGRGKYGKCTTSTKVDFVQSFGGPGDQMGKAIAVAGSIYIVGATSANGSEGMVAQLPLKMTTAMPTWSTSWPGLPGGDHFNSVAVGADAVYVVGDSYGRTSDSSDGGLTTLGAKDAKGMLVKFPFTGTNGAGFGGSVWDKQTPRAPGAFSYGGSERLQAAAAVMEEGVTYVYTTGSGQNSFGNSNRFFMVKMRHDSTNMWTIKDGATGGTTSGGGNANAHSEGRAITALNGFVYVAGRSDEFGYPAAFIRKYGPSGTNLWNLPWFSGQFNGVAAHGGSIYTVGQSSVDHVSTTNPTYTTNSLFQIAKWNEFGWLMWSSTLAADGHDENILNSVVGLGSRVYAVGSARNTNTMNRDVVMLEIDPENGSVLSTNIYASNLNQWANGIATDGDELYIIGETETIETGRDVLLMRSRVSQPVEPLGILTTSLPYAEVGVYYETVLAASGGKPFYNWSTTDELPDGLTLSPNGVISGVPLEPSSASLTFEVTDSAVASQSTTRPLTLLVVTENALPTVSFDYPTEGQSFTSPSYTNVATINFTITAEDSDGSIDAVKVYHGDNLLGTATGGGVSPYTFTAYDLPVGSHTFTALAYDNLGATNSSAELHVRINLYGTAVIDFEALDTKINPVLQTGTSNYLATYGVTITNETPGSTLKVYNDTLYEHGIPVRASSGHNFLGQFQKTGKTSYKLEFDTDLATFGFTRVGLRGGSAGVILPAWQATAYDDSGNELGTVGEDFRFSYADIPEETYFLHGPEFNIAYVRIVSDNRNFMPNSVLMDDFVLGTVVANQAPTVSITDPLDGAEFAAPANVTVTAAANDSDGTISQISFYRGLNFVETVATADEATTTLANLAAGTYTVRAVARDNGGAVRSSAPVTFTVTNAPGVSVINFDWANASGGNIGGVGLSNYLFGYGVIITNTTSGTRVEAADAGNLNGGDSVIPVSPRNVLSQFGKGGAVSFTLKFTNEVQSVQFSRPALLSGDRGVSHPQWSAHALDASGNELAVVGEEVIVSFSNVDANSFHLAAPGISSVRFNSDGSGRTAFPGVLIDDLIVNTNPVTNPLEVSITSPLDGAEFTAPANINFAAHAANHLGAVDHVQFYANSVFIGYDDTYPYSYDWQGVLPGSYELVALLVTDDFSYQFSDRINITVNGTVGNMTVINFDSVDASTVDVTNPDLATYLAGHGVTALTVDAYSQVTIRHRNNFFYGTGVQPSSDPNVLVHESFYGIPTDFTVYLDQAATNVGFTRPKLLAGYYSPVTQPAWSATAYDSAGNPVATVDEGAIFSYSDVDARRFSLSASGISFINFHVENNNYSYLSSLVIDDLILRRSTDNLPPSVAITEPATGSVFLAPANVILSADAVDPDGSITEVRFYLGGEILIGTDTNAPYSVVWTNLNKGVYQVVARATDNNGDVGIAAVTFRVRPKPTAFGIIDHPEDQTVAVGNTAEFSITTTEVGLPGIQWYYSIIQSQAGTVIIGETNSTLTLSGIEAADAGYYYATIVSRTNATLTETSDYAQLTVVAPPSITADPESQSVSSGETVTLTVTATGAEPLRYQWFVNGSRLKEATNATLSILNVQPYDSGNYYVVVKNDVGSAASLPANLSVIIGGGDVLSADDFADRLEINPLFSATFGNNCAASREAGEPVHAGKTGAKSIWYTWRATFTGSMSITTRGSSFDTMLAVYTGSDLLDLTLIAADDDKGGNLTSQVTFNCVEGVDYIFAVDGFFGSCGTVVIGLPPSGYRVLDAAGNESIPEITTQPESQTVAEGTDVEVTVAASGPPVAMTYQWYYNEVPILNATDSVLTLDNFTTGSVGRYTVVVANEFGSVESIPADIQIGEGGSRDKFGDSSIEVVQPPAEFTGGGKVPAGSAGTSRSFTTTQTLSTVGATKEPGEPNHCGEPGGASYWTAYQAATNQTVHINTDGSSFNTVLAVYTASGFDFGSLTLVACDNSSSGAGGDRVRFTATPGTIYYVAVDGVSGASGTLSLNLNEGLSPTITQQPQGALVAINANKTFTVDVTGSTNMAFQWKFNGANISGATSSSYVRTAAQASHEGSYQVVISNPINTTTSSVATLYIDAPPVIATQPASKTLNAGKNLTLKVTLSQGSAPLAYQWRKNGTPLGGRTSSTLTFTPIQTTDNGNYDVVITNNVENGSVTSSVAAVVVNVPAPTISTPANKAVLNNASSFTFTGKSVTNALITSIAYRVNTNAMTGTVSGLANWTVDLALPAGTNIVQFQATDSAGSNSAWSTRTVFYEITNTFHLNVVNGNGNLVTGSGSTPAADGLNLVVDRSYKLTAQQLFPLGRILTNWTATWLGQATPFTLQTNNLRYTFVMKSNLVINANYIVNPFRTYAGIYNGLFRETDAILRRSAGYMTLKTTERFTVSGKLLVDGDAVGISGKFRIDGTADLVGKRQAKFGKPDLNVHLVMDFEGATHTVTGSVVNASAPWTAMVVADRLTWSTNDVENPNPSTLYANAYTMVIPGFADPSEGPEGYGYSSVVVNHLGAIKAAGQTADGQKFTQSTTLSKDANWPFYMALYPDTNDFVIKTNLDLTFKTNAVKRTRGMLYSQLNFAENTDAYPENANLAPLGDVVWMRTDWTNTSWPTGFSNTVPVMSSLHQAPVTLGPTIYPFTNILVTCTEGSLSDPIVNTVGFLSNNKFVLDRRATNESLPYPYNHDFRFSFANKTGVTSGSFTNEANPKGLKWSGVILKDYTNGYGYFVNTNVVNGSGKVTITAGEIP